MNHPIFIHVFRRQAQAAWAVCQDDVRDLQAVDVDAGCFSRLSLYGILLCRLQCFPVNLLLSLVQGSDRLSIGVRKLAPTDHKIRHLLHCQCGDKFLHADTPLLDIDQGAAAEITRKPDHFLLVSFSCIGIVKGISQILIQILSLRCI